MVRGRRGGEAAWEKTREEPGPRIFQTDWASPTPLAVQKPWGWQSHEEALTNPISPRNLAGQVGGQR